MQTRVSDSMVKTEVDLSPLHVCRELSTGLTEQALNNFVEETNASQLHERKLKTVLLKPCDSDSDLNLMKHSVSHHRENFGRDKVIGRKWIYLEQHTPQIEWEPSQKRP